MTNFDLYNPTNYIFGKGQISKFNKILSKRSNGMFSQKLCAVDRSLHKIGCARRALGEFMKIFPFAYTLESSFLGYHPGGHARSALIPFHAEQLKMIGMHLANSIDEFFLNKSTNIDEYSKKRSKTSSESYFNDKSLWSEFVFGTSKELITNMRRSSISEDLLGKNSTISRLERLSTKRTHVRTKQTITRRPSIGSEYNRIIRL